MKAIDIMFNEIDKINSQIKLEKETYKKVALTLKIRKIINIIEDMDRLQMDDGRGYLPPDFCYSEKDYI